MGNTIKKWKEKRRKKQKNGAKITSFRVIKAGCIFVVCTPGKKIIFRGGNNIFPCIIICPFRSNWGRRLSTVHGWTGVYPDLPGPGSHHSGHAALCYPHSLSSSQVPTCHNQGLPIWYRIAKYFLFNNHIWFTLYCLLLCNVLSESKVSVTFLN